MWDPIEYLECVRCHLEKIRDTCQANNFHAHFNIKTVLFKYEDTLLSLTSDTF